MNGVRRRVLETTATFAVILAAVSVGGSSLWRLTRERAATGTTSPGARPPRYVDGWERLLTIGIPHGSPAAPLTVIEFADMECPFCRVMHARLEEIGSTRGAAMRRVLVHYPLPQHRFAMFTASLLECAEQEGRFRSMLSSLYASQDSFGLRPWEEIARGAGVRSATATVACARAGAGSARIAAGKAAGDSLRLPGTPTLLINGWLYVGLPPDALERELDRRLPGGS